MDLDWQPIVSAALGGVSVIGMAKYFLQRTAERIDKMPEQLAEITAQLAAMRVEISGLTEMKRMVHSHDRSISALLATVKRPFEVGRTDD